MCFDEIRLCARNVAGPIANKWKGQHVCFERKRILLLNFITFTSHLQFETMKWRFALFPITNHIKQFPIQSNTSVHNKVTYLKMKWFSMSNDYLQSFTKLHGVDHRSCRITPNTYKPTNTFLLWVLPTAQ